MRHTPCVAQMKPAAAIAYLAQHLKSGEALPDAARRQLVEALDLHLSDNVPLDKALGLRTWGGISPSHGNALENRNQLLRRLWRTSPEWQNLEPGAAARLMALSASRYETTRFPRERGNLGAPAFEPAITWWLILRKGRVPKAKRLQQILAMEIQDGI